MISSSHNWQTLKNFRFIFLDYYVKKSQGSLGLVAKFRHKDVEVLGSHNASLSLLLKSHPSPTIKKKKKKLFQQKTTFQCVFAYTNHFGQLKGQTSILKLSQNIVVDLLSSFHCSYFQAVRPNSLIGFWVCATGISIPYHPLVSFCQCPLQSNTQEDGSHTFRDTPFGDVLKPTIIIFCAIDDYQLDI